MKPVSTAAMMMLFVLCAVPVFAQPTKEPWTLTVDERIALRTDAELAEQRVRDHNHFQASIDPAAIPDVAADSFDGRTHPELFLPHQVFITLVEMAFLGPPRDTRILA